MRSILLCITLLFFGLVSEGQTNVASLNITLTDVQSVTFSNAALNEVAPDGKQLSRNAGLNVLTGSTSQIKKISSKNSEYERLYKEFYTEKAHIGQSSSSKNNYSLAVNSASSTKKPKSQNTTNLVIYQIDPR